MGQVSRGGRKGELDPLGFKTAHDLQIDALGEIQIGSQICIVLPR